MHSTSGGASVIRKSTDGCDKPRLYRVGSYCGCLFLVIGKINLRTHLCLTDFTDVFLYSEFGLNRHLELVEMKGSDFPLVDGLRDPAIDEH